MKIRLHQFLSKSGEFASKSEVKQAIWNGEVSVNGSVVKDIAFQFKTGKKKVEYKGNELFLPVTDFYFLLNKPKGFICSRINSQERELDKVSVYELFRDKVDVKVFESLITVGRLDEDTTGFLLVTTDGKLVHSITEPKKHIKKTYRVETESVISDEDLSSIRSGLKVSVVEFGVDESFETRPAIIELEHEKCAILTIDEGKKRQIRRMFKFLGNHVVELHRLSTEKMKLSDYQLESGEFCQVTRGEINTALFS